MKKSLLIIFPSLMLITLAGCGDNSSSQSSSSQSQITSSSIPASSSSAQLAHAGTIEDPLSPSDALILASDLYEKKGTTETKYYIKGLISEVDTSSGHFNFYLDDDTSSIYCYGLYNANDEEYGSAEGLIGLTGTPLKNDTITVYANIQNYYGTFELINSTLIDVVEGVHEQTSQTPFNPNDLDWINDVASITSGRYIIGGFVNYGDLNNYFLMSHSLSSYLSGTKVDEKTVSLIAEDYTYDVSVNGSKISIKNTQNGKYVAYSGDGTKLAWSNEEVFLNLMKGTLSDKAAIRVTFDGTTRKIQTYQDGRFAAYSQNQKSDLTFAKVD